jgi:Cu-Zn family superoxide dismutase
MAAIAVLKTSEVEGIVTAYACTKTGSTSDGSTILVAEFSKLPPGKHGFHIHKAGDLSGEGCKGACEHYHRGPPASHGGPPISRNQGRKQTRKKGRSNAAAAAERHTGDLGNIAMPSGGRKFKRTYMLENVPVSDLWGRSIIVHADPDDLGRGHHDDSKTTGHSGKRIACGIFGRGGNCS